ncbi:hypothetical protein QJ857_gp0747 [Tupanvirus soda lake]|uniref:DUF305 domain-containing protein n=2 Tax=Tupanvirus TaxID=2094720 RepID=A0A6N1P2Q1_9VIRU|nr:hypothetical protein QJ857_gp0747 [Tupanvirus soda lake]QKU35301.1 hypothetical protein [Tupanvirus soda lake]
MNHSSMQSSMFWPMIGLMVVFSYLVMDNVMLTFKNGIYNHVNKAYMALLMGGLMGMIHYIIMIWQGHRSKEMWYGLAIWTIVSLVFIILIRKQTLVNDKEFLKGMTEHHDMALLMSREIVNKTKDNDLANFANYVIKTQQEEINWMKNKLRQK